VFALDPKERRVLPAACLCFFSLWLGVLVFAAGAHADGVPANWHRGASFTSWWHDTYEKAEAARQLDALRATGTTHVEILTTWYMSDRTSSSIAPDSSRTPSDAGLLAVIGKARSLGMSVALKPHVDLRDGTFRGAVAPANVAAWFRDYRRMLIHYADLARAGQADMLVVGTELTTMAVYAEQWRNLISEVRARYKGSLTFAANWVDGARKVEFWRELDFIGIDAYMPLVWNEPNPSVKSLATAWCSATDPEQRVHRYVDEITALHSRYRKPVLFTEIGYESRYGTATTPWGAAAGAISDEPQQRAYEAAYQVWARPRWFAGLYWWDWPASGSSSDPGSFTPADKPAQATMTTWNTSAEVSAAGSDPCPKPIPSSRPASRQTVIELRLKAWRHGKRRIRRLKGRVTSRGDGCVQLVRVRIERRSRRTHRWHKQSIRRARPSATGSYTARPGHLRPGLYRVRAYTAGSVCGAARSRPLRFRVRLAHHGAPHRR
jgi:hypothetical protein